MIEEAKKLSLIYKDQAYQAGSGGRYPEELETYRTTKNGLRLFLRPVKISDERLLKDFFYSLSDKSMYKRFLTRRQDMPHAMLQDMFVIIDYSQKMVILALQELEDKEEVVGVAQYGIDEMEHTA